MDTSELYIKMCEKAIKIQEQWKPKLYDVVNPKGYNSVQNIVNFGKVGDDEYIVIIPGKEGWIQPNELVWLPRQDQLQELISENWNDGQKSMFFEEWRVNSLLLKYTTPDYSMEQLWLAFVMYKKYNKIWKEYKWLKIGD